MFDADIAAFVPSLSKVIRPIEPAVRRFVFTPTILETYRTVAEQSVAGPEFARGVLRQLGIEIAASKEDLSRIPRSGPAIIVANHPFGMLEGLAFTAMLDAVRPDARIVANSLLGSIAQLRDHFILVDAFESGWQNTAVMRACIGHLRAGGLLVVFPAGEVAHLNWDERPVADPEWKTTAARLAMRTGAPVIPAFFEGTNSLRFQMLGLVHPKLRTISLPRELANKRERTIQVRFGGAVCNEALRNLGGPEHATAYLRARVYALGNRPRNAAPPISAKQSFTACSDAVASELVGLPPLANSGDLVAYRASAVQIPNILQEIGRARELTFRAVGEGTGKPVDLDEFDEHYDHLFLWHASDRRIAGAYRIAATPDILKRFGQKGLYTNTLFQFAPDFFDRLGPAFELGRSWIHPAYQRSYAALLLLWKAIGGCVAARPEIRVLFGAVSISREYQPLSRAMMTSFVSQHMMSDLAPLVRPRRAYRKPLLVPKEIKRLATFVRTLDDLSELVSDLEPDAKGVPVLMRQYAKLGGKFLGFNLDKKFSDVVDGLLVTDLRDTPPQVLARFLPKQKS